MLFRRSNDSTNLPQKSSFHFSRLPTRKWMRCEQSFRTRTGKKYTIRAKSELTLAWMRWAFQRSGSLLLLTDQLEKSSSTWPTILTYDSSISTAPTLKRYKRSQIESPYGIRLSQLLFPLCLQEICQWWSWIDESARQSTKLSIAQLSIQVCQSPRNTRELSTWSHGSWRIVRMARAVRELSSVLQIQMDPCQRKLLILEHRNRLKPLWIWRLMWIS